MTYLSFYPFLTTIISLILVKVLMGIFQQKIVDVPNERSSHTQPTPRGGGLGFILSFFIILTLGLQIDPTISVQSILPWLALLPLVIVGFIDDWKDLPAFTRYLVQITVSIICVALLGSFPIFSGDSTMFSIVELGLTVIGMTALINFYNFMDGLDGLLAGISAVQLSFLAIWSSSNSLWILVAGVLGFIVWNWNPAKIFMGDAGSTFLGAAVAVAILSQPVSQLDAWATLTLTLGITVDTVYTLIRRSLNGENIFQAHRSHLYQRLHQAKWSHAQVASLYIIATLLCGLTLLALGPAGGWVNLIGAGLSLFAVESYLKRKELAKPLSP